MKGAPNTTVVIAGATVIVALITSVTIIGVTGGDTRGLYDLVNTLLNSLTLLMASGGLVVAGAGYSKAGAVKEQLDNGFKHEIAEEVKHTLEANGLEVKRDG